MCRSAVVVGSCRSVVDIDLCSCVGLCLCVGLWLMHVCVCV